MYRNLKTFDLKPGVRFRCVGAAVLAIVASTLHANVTSGENQARPLTAADAVSMAEVIRSNNAADLKAPSQFTVSPNGEKVVMVTRRCNLETGNNDYQIHLYEVGDLLEFANDESDPGGPLPHGELLATLSTDSRRYAVQRLRWLDDRSIAFIGEREELLVAQVYRLDIVSKKMEQLTDHPEKVVSFDINQRGDLVFNASVPVPGFEDVDSFLVGDRNVFEKMEMQLRARSTSEERAWFETFFQGADTDSSPRHVGEPFIGGLFMHDLWVSPTGEWAVSGKVVPTKPTTWIKEYRPLADNTRLVQFFDRFGDDASGEYFLLWYLELLNLRDGTAEPLFDAPIANRVGGFPFNLQWMEDGKSVIVGNTFLPLDVADPRELERRRQSPAVVEFNIETGQFTRIMEHTVLPGETSTTEAFSDLKLMPDGTLIIQRTEGPGWTHGERLSDSVFRKNTGRWTEITDPQLLERIEAAQLGKKLELTIQQDLNTPPNVLARDRSTGSSRVMTDLNPQLRDLLLGRAEVINWNDRSGREWEAGVVYPPDFEEGRRYPLVIQTHGFDKRKFLIDGPFRGAYAAQALANKGMVVIQVQDQSLKLVDSSEREMYRYGIEAAIDSLDERGLIDRDRVGIMGFSRTGHHVLHIMTFSEYEFAGATVADAFNVSYMGYVVLFGTPGIEGIEDMMDGAVPWGERMEEWVEKNECMHLDRVKTPLRLEQYTLLLNWWDIYVLLKRQEKPAEWLVLLDAGHELVRPKHRLMVQEGNVDWFTFWLKDEEDPDPAKAEQYRRWRALQEQQISSERAADAARARDREAAARTQD